VDAPVDAPVGAPVGAPADAPEAPEACPLPPANPAPNGEITSPKPVLGATAALHEELRLKAERKRFELRGKVEEIRQHIAPLTVTELWAARFLSSRRGDCKKAAQQLKHVWAFRERERAAASLDPDEGPQAPEVEAALAAYDLCTLEGLDGQGRPVFYACPGKVEMATMSKQGVTLAMVVRRHFRAMERLVQRIDAAPCPYDGHSVVLDMHGMSMGKFLRSIRIWREVVRIGEHYPELLSAQSPCIYIVRLPSASLVWCIDMVKGLLDKETASKIIHSTGEAWPALRDNFGETSTAVLPKELAPR